MAMITAEELETLLSTIEALEARNDYLERLHILNTEGTAALLKRYSAVEPYVGEIPAGHAIGNAGQLIRVA